MEPMTTQPVVNHYAADVTQLERNEFGMWQRREIVGDWEATYSCSDEGRAQLADFAVIWDQHAEALWAWMDVYGLTVCQHGRPLDDLSWDICDYWFDHDKHETPLFSLSGFHWDVADQPYCLPWAYSALGIFWRVYDD